VNSKKEMFVASLLAIALAAGLGTISYGLFAEAPSQKLESRLDIYTPKGGIGVNVSSGTFEPFEIAPVFAYLTHGGIPVKSSEVTFTITPPNGTEMVKTVLTNDTGVAETDISFLPPEGDVIGTWQVLANASANKEAVDATLTLQCKSENARIDVFSRRNGAASNSFLPLDEVFLEAQVTYKNASIVGAPVTFEVKMPNNTEFLSQTIPTDSLGTANVTFQIPSPSDLSLGTWQAQTTSQIYGQALNATTNFDCELLLPVIDVYTQKGGYGPNGQGGNFVLNETVSLYAEVRNALNHTVRGILVGFEVRKYGVSSGNVSVDYVRTQTANDSGIAYLAHSIFPDPAYAGTYVVYVSAEYEGILLLDTLTFTVQEQ
jgi:hypothetical protein